MPPPAGRAHPARLHCAIAAAGWRKAALNWNILAPRRRGRYMMGMIMAEDAVLIPHLPSPGRRRRTCCRAPSDCLVTASPDGRSGRRRLPKPAAVALLFCAALALTALPSQAAQKQKDQPLFLVARSDLKDPYFWHSVVLMLPFSPDPLVVGIIINRPTRIALHDLFPHNPSLQGKTGAAYFGGPVSVREPSMVFRAAKAPEQSTHLFGNVYLTSDASLMEKVLGDPDQRRTARLFLGRAQWAPTQLQGEILDGSWYRLRAEGSVIFNPDAQHIWHDLFERVRPGNVAENLYAHPEGMRQELLPRPAEQPSW